jgi:hypothetical protein
VPLRGFIDEALLRRPAFQDRIRSGRYRRLNRKDPPARAHGRRGRPEKHPTQACGRGIHICLGQFLAVANVEEGIHIIARRLTNPKLAGEVKWKPFPEVRGITSLPITFGAVTTPEAAAEPA